MDLFTLLLEAFAALINIAAYGMMLAENWAGIIQTAASCAIALCAVLGTRAAYKGLDAWREEHDGKSKLDSAKKILIILHKISEFPTALSSHYVGLNNFKFPEEGKRDSPIQSRAMAIQLNSFIDQIEDENKFEEYITIPDKINNQSGRYTFNPPLYEELSKTIEDKISAYNKLKEESHLDVFDASITINKEIKPLYEELLRTLDEMFDTYRRVLVILDPKKQEFDKALKYEIIYNKFSMKCNYNKRRLPDEPYMSGFIREFNAKKIKIEKLAVDPLNHNQTSEKLSWRRILKRKYKKI
ncbi:hypothetical protein [uncultured Gilvimarinus sp.]|uniref:hypothetical protein n=1 Tax=uncultured Gilvimarinus sp. TaxID=1689143 RepID=UPI0030DB7A9E